MNVTTTLIIVLVAVVAIVNAPVHLKRNKLKNEKLVKMNFVCHGGKLAKYFYKAPRLPECANEGEFMIGLARRNVSVNV